MIMKSRCVVVCLTLVAAGAASSCSVRSPAPTAFDYHLYTHCGVKSVTIDSHHYVADHPLDDGNGNPPQGWGNPYQPGTITLTSPTTAVFTEAGGHRVGFRLDPDGVAPDCD